MNSPQPPRRRFLIQAAIATSALPLLGVLGSETAQAQALKKLPASNPQAIALKYVEDASKTTEAAHKPGSICGNCQFFTAATGACTLFAGFSVSTKGWCSAWAKKA